MPGTASSVETQALAQLAQRVDISRLLVPETEVFADQNDAGVQASGENPFREFFRRQLCKIERKRKQKHGFDSFRFHAAQPLVDRHEQLRRAVGRQHASGMRIESEHGRRAAPFARQSHHAPHDLAVADVDAVEIADGDDGGSESCRELRLESERSSCGVRHLISRPS